MYFSTKHLQSNFLFSLITLLNWRVRSRCNNNDDDDDESLFVTSLTKKLKKRVTEGFYQLKFFYKSIGSEVLEYRPSDSFRDPIEMASM